MTFAVVVWFLYLSQAECQVCSAETHSTDSSKQLTVKRSVYVHAVGALNL